MTHCLLVFPLASADPSAAGLQVTPSGQPKILDVVDATGSGDVATVVTAGSKLDTTCGLRVVQGLTGRTLKLNPAWQNPSDVWRLGVKHATELYPSGEEGGG